MTWKHWTIDGGWHESPTVGWDYEVDEGLRKCGTRYQIRVLTVDIDRQWLTGRLLAPDVLRSTGPREWRRGELIRVEALSAKLWTM